jgi:hypothetical protein
MFWLKMCNQPFTHIIMQRIDREAAGMSVFIVRFLQLGRLLKNVNYICLCKLLHDCVVSSMKKTKIIRYILIVNDDQLSGKRSITKLASKVRFDARRCKSSITNKLNYCLLF